MCAVFLTALVGAGCHDGDDGQSRQRAGPPPLRACVEAWNRPPNFGRGRPGELVRRLRPRPVVPIFAHVSRDRRRRCVVFLDTPSTVDDRRFVVQAGIGGQVVEAAERARLRVGGAERDEPEPRRLLPRYLYFNPRFVLAFARQYLSRRT